MNDQLIPWTRFWAPLGAALNLGDNGTGFLADPESGLGRAWSPNTFHLQELLSIPCLVLCGEPGMGKSSELELSHPQIANAAGGAENLISLGFRDIPDRAVFDELVFNSTKWKNWESSATAPLTLLIDGLDEGLIRIPRFLEYLATKFAGIDVKRLNLRLVCRVAEWPETEGSRVLSLWGESKNPRIYELCPLRHKDALQGATFWGASPQPFIEAIYDRHIVPLAARPVTLRLLAREFAHGRVLGRTRDEIYEAGLLRLCEEPDQARAKALRRSGTLEATFTATEMKEMASRIAGLLLLSGKVGVFIGNNEDTPAGLLTLEQVWVANAGQRERDLVAAALATGLFAALGSQRLGFAHQTFAEYLTAAFLSEMELPQIRPLLCDRDHGREHIVPQLAETAAWLTLRKPEFLRWIIDNEPDALLRNDTSRIPPDLKLRLVSSLLERAKQEEAFDERSSDRFYSGFAHPQLTKLLRPYIQDSSLNIVVRRMAIGIARACKLTEVMDDLLAILKNEHSGSIRHFVAHALEDLTPDARIAELIPFAKGEGGPDPDDSLRGCALQRLVPAVWSVAEAAKVFVQPNNSNYFGSYNNVLTYYLPEHLKPQDVPAVLKRLNELADCLDTYGFFRTFTSHTLITAATGLDLPEVATAVVAYWTTQSREHRYLIGHENKEFVAFLHENQPLRLRLVETLLLTSSLKPEEVEDIAACGNLPLSGDDLEWLLQKLPHVPQERRAAWAMATQCYCRHPVVHTHWDLFLRRLEDCPELKAHFPWLRAWVFDEPIAQEAKARWLRQKQLEKQFQRPVPVSRLQHIQQNMDALATGKPRQWASLSWNLWLSDDGTTYKSVDYDLVTSPGWQSATPEQRKIFLDAAKNFLLQCIDNGDNNQSTYPATWAIWLLRDKVKNDQQLREAVTAKWIRALLHAPNPGREFHQEMVALAFELAPAVSTHHLFEELERQNGSHGDLSELHSFRKCWNSELSKQLIDWMKHTPLKPNALGNCLAHLSIYAPLLAVNEIHSRLVPAPIISPENIAEIAEIADAALAYLPRETWAFTWPVIQSDLTLGKDLVLKLSNDMRHSGRSDGQKWNEEQLADLYLLSKKFFQTEPPQSEDGSYTPEMTVADFQRNLLGQLVAAATKEACNQLLRMANELPNERIWLRWRHMECLRAKRRVNWSPPDPGFIIELHSKVGRRLVKDEDDLLEVIIESLDRFQKQITNSINPDAEIFWHWDGADTKRRNFPAS